MEVPKLNYTDLLTVDEALSRVRSDKKLFYARFIQAMNDNLINEQVELKLFIIEIANNIPITVYCAKKEWTSMLHNAKVYYENLEFYETCQVIVKLEKHLKKK